MPIREDIEQSSTTLSSVTVEVFNNGFVSTDSRPSDATFTTLHRVKAWGTTPDYNARRKAKARLPDLGFSFDLTRRSDDKINYVGPVEVFEGGGPWDVHSRQRTFQKVPASYVAASQGELLLSSDEAISRLLSNAKGAEFNAPVFLGEARETVNMVLKTANTLATAYRSLRRGDIRRAYTVLRQGEPRPREVNRFNREYGRNARQAAANRWLELQYGWTPLLLEVKSAAEQMAEFQLDSVSSIGTVRSSDKLLTRSTRTVQIEVSPPSTARVRETQLESVRAVWAFRPKELNGLGSLGLLNPLSVAWELLPLSFVVDWMFPIGRYLEQLDVPLRFEHVGGTLGYRRSVSASWDTFIRDGIAGSGTYQTSFTTVRREPFTTIPSLGLNSVLFNPNLGVKRLLSGLALASQAFRR